MDDVTILASLIIGCIAAVFLLDVLVEMWRNSELARKRRPYTTSTDSNAYRRVSFCCDADVYWDTQSESFICEKCGGTSYRYKMCGSVIGK